MQSPRGDPCGPTWGLCPTKQRHQASKQTGKKMAKVPWQRRCRNRTCWVYRHQIGTWVWLVALCVFGSLAQYHLSSPSPQKSIMSQLQTLLPHIIFTPNSKERGKKASMGSGSASGMGMGLWESNRIPFVDVVPKLFSRVCLHSWPLLQHSSPFYLFLILGRLCASVFSLPTPRDCCTLIFLFLPHRFTLFGICISLLTLRVLFSLYSFSSPITAFHWFTMNFVIHINIPLGF